MWTPAQQKAFARAIEMCAKYDAQIDTLREIAKHSPAIAGRMEELRIKCDQVRAIAQTAVSAESMRH